MPARLRPLRFALVAALRPFRDGMASWSKPLSCQIATGAAMMLTTRLMCAKRYAAPLLTLDQTLQQVAITEGMSIPEVEP
jgi:hypothetical protein